MTLYIATDTNGTAIYGLGDSAELAIDDALSQCADLTDLVTMPCTEALARYVDERGGNISWNVVDGVAYRYDEMHPPQKIIAEFCLAHAEELSLGDADISDLQADLHDGVIDRTYLWDMWSDKSYANLPELWEAASEVQAIAILAASWRISPF